MQMLGNGVYTFAEASRLTHLTPSRLREWFASSRGESMFTGDYPAVSGDRAISFLDMIDALVAGMLRNSGVSLQMLRRVYSRLEADFQWRHPFCRRELYTNGEIVFVRTLDEAGDEQLIEIITRQQVFPRVLLPFLKKIEYDNQTSMATKWKIAKNVVIDPQICFGKPMIASRGIATYILAAEYEANNRNAEAVAKWYRVRPSEVLAAVKFERQNA